MDKHDRFIAINQTLPGLEDFLKVVLGSEPLSEEANRQRIEFLRRLEGVSRPPSLPPRPANLNEIYRGRLQQNEQAQSGSSQQDESSVYKNDRTVDPVEFASQQRELSRVHTLYKTYVPPQTVFFGEKGSSNGGLFFTRPGNSRDGIRDSIQSTSSAEDDIYEHLSLKSASPAGSVGAQDVDAGAKTEESFVFPSPPKTPQDHSSGIYVPTRSGSLRGSGGKGKLPTGWFNKKETKVNEEVYVSNLREPVIKGYLKDIKANKRRWCVLQGNRLHIFKTQEDPAIMILYLPDCNIGVDDKKKISYSFRLIPADGPGVTLAIEDGQDLSPWMSAIMAAAVRRSSIDRPSSPLEGLHLFTLEQARAERMRSAEMDGGGIEEENEEDIEEIYEEPVVHSMSGIPITRSTAAATESKEDEEVEDEGYNVPLPPIPIDDDDSSSESSSDEDESAEKMESSEKATEKKKIYDAIPPDLLAELSAVQHKGGSATNKSQDSICDEGSTNDQSLDFTDSHSEHSGNISNRHSYIEPIASDDTGSSEPKEEKTDSLSRKRTSTVLSLSTESMCSDTEDTRTSSVTSEASVTSKGLGPKVKRRRKLVPAEAELQFLQDPSAMHSGILYQKRRLVWSKRYCKIIDSRFKCYRNPADQKPTLNFPILGYDISLIDNKESKKGYCIKISHPSQETYYFATDSRVSIERWIEVLSLAATGRLDVIAPYPPYFCAEQSGDELKSRSRESLLSSEGRLSDDESADTLDELDPPSEGSHSLNRLARQANEDTMLPNDTRNVEFPKSAQTQTKPQEGGVQQSPETVVKQRTHKKRKEKPSEGTKTPSTMSPPHSMFISESVDGQAKPEPMNEDAYVSRPAPGKTKESSEDSSPKKDRRWTETLKKKKLARGQSYDYRLRGNVTSSSHPENAKNKPPTMRRKNSQTFTHLINLFDKEGRFCGYLTEVKYNKFGTTHLRRWCVVKNGMLILFNSESEDMPQGKLSLVDMWLTDKSDESRNKFGFTLEDKEGKETTLQTTVKEDFQKWMGVLELFTELRVERPQPEMAAADPLRKSDSASAEEGEGLFERGTLSRAATKIKDEIYALAPGKVRTSLRMKLSQRVNVRDIFRKTHSSYDLELGAPAEGSSLPEADIDTLAVFGGLLTQVEPNASTNSRWCTIKEKELLIFSDRKASDPLQRISLLRSAFSDLSENEINPNRFQVRHGKETIVFDAWDKFDHNRWLRMLASASETRNSSDDDDGPKCVGRLTSPTFTRKSILHRRTRSEALPQEGGSPTTSVPCHTKTKKESTSSSTDRLMSGYLQEVRETNGARTLLRRWCVATSERFSVYDNQNSKKASFDWELSQMEVQDQSDMDAGSFGFCVLLGNEKLCFKVIDEDSARHWLSVLARYCHAVPANQPLFTPPPRSNSKEERRRSASDNDLKSKSAEKETNVLEVLSEGRASGRKLLRRATEDSTFFRKFNRSEMFKAPWRASTEKLEVKMRERSGRSAANKALKRFSCGSLFDSDGKYSSHLMEVITSELYSSQVRRWCVQKDDYLYIYENEAADTPIKVVPLFNAKVVDTSDIEACLYRFRIDYGEGNAVFFRPLTRSDLEKWTTVISVKTAVLQDRSERQLRRSRTLSSERNSDATGSSESEVTTPELKPSPFLSPDSASLNETVSICSSDSVFASASDPVASVEEETSTSGSAGLKPVDSNDEAGNTSVNLKDEQPLNEQREEDAGLSPAERTVSEAESSDSNRKTVSRLSSIEDLSHIYENFLAFASAMVEKSPEFQQQLYHVYENVTQALDTGVQGNAQSEENVTQTPDTGVDGNAQSEAQIAEERLGDSAGQETNEGNNVRSPSMEMSSEFEKISLQENEEKDRNSSHVYRYSGICGELELEKLVDDVNETEQDATDTVTLDENIAQNETSPDEEMLSGGLAGETEHAAMNNPSRVDGELLEVSVSSDGDKELVNNTVVGGSQLETVTCRNDSESEELNDSDTDCIKVNTSDELNQLLSESAEKVNEAATSQAPENDPKNEGEVNSAVHIGSSLLRADHVSAVESGESSFYLVEEVNDQLWREIEGKDVSEPVIETCVVLDAVQVSTSCDVNYESLMDRDSLASVVEKSASSEHEEDRATNVELQDLKDIYECTEDDHNNPNDNQDSFNKVNVSEADPRGFVVVDAEDYKKELQVNKPDLLEGGNTSHICTGRTLEVIQNVCTTESLDVSLPVALKCSKEAEVRCEQTLASEVCESEHAQRWEEAVTRVDESAVTRVDERAVTRVEDRAVISVDESPSSTTQDFELENQTLLESPSTDLETIDLASVDDSPEVQRNEMCDNSNQEDAILNNDGEFLLCNQPCQTNRQDSNPETGVDTVEAHFGSETICNLSEGSYAAFNQREENQLDGFTFSDEHAAKFQSPDTEVCSNDSLDSELLKENSSLQQDIEEADETLDEGIDLGKRCFSDEEYYTPEDTLELSVRSDSVADETDTEVDSANSKSRNSNPELDCAKDERNSAESESVLESETEDVTTPCVQQYDELPNEHVPDAEPDSETHTGNTNLQSESLDTWSNNSSLEDKQDLTRSQMDILKAVTAAFEEILELHGEDSDADDTRL